MLIYRRAPVDYPIEAGPLCCVWGQHSAIGKRTGPAWAPVVAHGQTILPHLWSDIRRVARCPARNAVWTSRNAANGKRTRVFGRSESPSRAHQNPDEHPDYSHRWRGNLAGVCRDGGETGHQQDILGDQWRTNGRAESASVPTSSTPTAPSPLRTGGKLCNIGVGRTHARTHLLMLVQDLHVRIINAATGAPTCRCPAKGGE